MSSGYVPDGRSPGIVVVDVDVEPVSAIDVEVVVDPTPVPGSSTTDPVGAGDPHPATSAAANRAIVTFRMQEYRPDVTAA